MIIVSLTLYGLPTLLTTIILVRLTLLNYIICIKDIVSINIEKNVYRIFCFSYGIRAITIPCEILRSYGRASLILHPHDRHPQAPPKHQNKISKMLASLAIQNYIDCYNCQYMGICNVINQN